VRYAILRQLSKKEISAEISILMLGLADNVHLSASAGNDSVRFFVRRLFGDRGKVPKPK
jgi:hypothetical protein